MLFNIEPDFFESKKERNLYYKFFAGYFFNELIDGYEHRLHNFLWLLQNPTHVIGEPFPAHVSPSSEHTHVSFDNHAHHIVGTNRGEFADIAVHDRLNHIMVAIEAKFLDDWNFQKDVIENAARLKEVGATMPETAIVPCLLVTRKKWINGWDKQMQQGSNTKKLLSYTNRLLVLQWDSFLDLSLHPSVHAYLEHQLKLAR